MHPSLSLLAAPDHVLPWTGPFAAWSVVVLALRRQVSFTGTLCIHQFLASKNTSQRRAVESEARVGVPAAFQKVVAAVADIVLSTAHAVVQLAIGNLRLNHPELSQVPRGVRVLSSEGRPAAPQDAVSTEQQPNPLLTFSSSWTTRR